MEYIELAKIAWDVLFGAAKMAWDVLSGVTKTACDVLSGVANRCGMFCAGCQKMAWDVLSSNFLTDMHEPKDAVNVKAENMIMDDGPAPADRLKDNKEDLDQKRDKDQGIHNF